MMFISHCSCYSACFRRHRSSAPSSELRQKLSPSCVLVLWLKPTFEQCRNAVKMRVWFIHLACHSKLLMLAKRGFTPSSFPWFQHLCIQLSGALNRLVYALVLHRPLSLHPSTHSSCARILGHSAKLTDWHRQSQRRAWSPQKPAPVPEEGKGEPLKMGKQ